MYGKVFAQMYTGSMVGSGPVVFSVWGYVLANMHLPQAQPAQKVRGVASIELNPVLLAAIIGTTQEEIVDAIEKLCNPDPNSRTPDEDGRRLIREGQFLYRVVNAMKYDGVRNEIERREYMRNLMQRKREREREAVSANVSNRKHGLAKLADRDRDRDINNTLPHAGEGAGFGVAIPVTPPNGFDVQTATKLEAAVKKLPPRVTGITKAKPSTWTHHLKLLRTKDGIKEDDITRVMKWYTAHIGEEFVPEAYSGEAFRKKWPALERAAGRDTTVVLEISPPAAAVAQRLRMAHWPKGSAAAVPGAAQACITAYTAWRARRKAFQAKLGTGGVDLEPKRAASLLRFGNQLKTMLPFADVFAEEWLRNVNKDIAKWDAWHGDLSRHVFKPESGRFTAMGRGWAGTVCNNPEMWNRYIEIMNKEIP